MRITERIFSLLKEMGLSQQSLAEGTGISTGTIGAWKTRGSSPSADSIPAIANFLGVTCDFLLTGKETTMDLDADAIEIAREWRKLDKRSRIIIQAEIYKAALEDESNEYAEEFHIGRKAT